MTLEELYKQKGELITQIEIIQAKIKTLDLVKQLENSQSSLQETNKEIIKLLNEKQGN